MSVGPLRFVPGKSIHPCAAPDVLYVDGRSIAALRAVGAFDDVTAAVANRVDAVVSGDGRDGRLQIAEAVGALDDDIAAAFDDDERVRAPLLLQALAWQPAEEAYPAPAPSQRSRPAASMSRRSRSMRTRRCR
jgi:hypothetical protein